MSRGGVSTSRYEQLVLIGRGGMGEVFLGCQLGSDGFRRPVALKRVIPAFAHSTELRRMFAAEASIMAGLSHPNICQTIDVCSLDDDIYLVLEYLEGVTVGALIREVGALPVEVVGGILVQVCAGLEHAHAKGLIHRDLSPSNLFVTRDGLVKILDFGVAKIQGSDQSSSGLKGKSSYMSPEHVAGKPIDNRSDLFALGTLAIEALTGQPLFRRESDFLTYQAILEATRPVHIVESPLDTLLTACVSVDPDDRPPSARDLAKRVRNALHDLGGEASQQDLADYLQHNMQDHLEQLRARSTAALERPPQSSPVILHTAQLQLPPDPGGPTDHLGHYPAAAAPAAMTGQPGRSVGRRRSSKIFLVVLTLCVVGGVALALITTRGNTPVAQSPAPAMLDAASTGASSISDASAVSGYPASGADASDADSSAATPVQAAPADAAPQQVSSTGAKSNKPPAISRPRRTGTVSIDASPFAQLWIDGRNVGTTPLLDYRLPEGVHQVRARTKDGRTRRFRIRVRGDRHSTERIVFD